VTSIGEEKLIVNYHSYSILIATRNRARSLQKLLNSISQSTIQPLEIVIVSTGNEIEDELTMFDGKLPIRHFHLSGYGQIRQKLFGISKLSNAASWVLFLDDDLLLLPSAVESAFDALARQISNNRIVGLGLSQGNQLDLSAKELLLKLLGTHGHGRVWKSGTNINYMGSKKIIETEWLNGVGLWRFDVLSNYHFDYLQSRYSICEDLIFSYRNSKVGKLLFVPAAKFEFQEAVSALSSSYDSFRANAYWRLYFVKSNSELSVRLFLFFQLYRTLTYCTRSSDRSTKLKQRISSAFAIYFDCIKVHRSGMSPVNILKSRNV